MLKINSLHMYSSISGLFILLCCSVSPYINTLFIVALHRLDIRWYNSSNFIFPFQNCFSSSRTDTFLHIYKHLSMILSVSGKSMLRFWLGCPWMYRSSWEEMEVLTILSLPNHQHLSRSFSQEYFIVFNVEIFHIFYMNPNYLMMLL